MVRRHITSAHVEKRALRCLGEVAEVLRTPLGELEFGYGDDEPFAHAAYLFHAFVAVEIFRGEESGYLRNGVYALSGKIFTAEKYAQYFSAQRRYEGFDASDDSVTAEFNQFQKETPETNPAYEKEFRQAPANR